MNTVSSALSTYWYPDRPHDAISSATAIRATGAMRTRDGSLMPLFNRIFGANTTVRSA